LLVVQNRALEIRDIHKLAAIACGAKVTSGYFQLLSKPISEFIFHLEATARAVESLSPKKPDITLGGPVSYG